MNRNLMWIRREKACMTFHFLAQKNRIHVWTNCGKPCCFLFSARTPPLFITSTCNACFFSCFRHQHHKTVRRFLRTKKSCAANLLVLAPRWAHVCFILCRRCYTKRHGTLAYTNRSLSFGLRYQEPNKFCLRLDTVAYLSAHLWGLGTPSLRQTGLLRRRGARSGQKPSQCWCQDSTFSR